MDVCLSCYSLLHHKVKQKSSSCSLQHLPCGATDDRKQKQKQKGGQVTEQIDESKELLDLGM